jgi:hypothetical protein
VRFDSEIPLWGVITAAVTGIVSIVGWTFRLSSRLEKVERELTDLNNELAEVKSDVHSMNGKMDARVDKDQTLLIQILERLARIETKLEEKR